MSRQKDALVYIKNMKDPSAYYRLGQYLEDRDDVRFSESVPDGLYCAYYDSPGGKTLLLKLMMALTTQTRATLYILWDLLFYHSRQIIVNRQVYPRVMPFFGEALLNLYFSSREVYWDFDDNILYDHAITKKEAVLLERYAKQIVVTSEFLKQTLPEECQDKTKTLPTTDLWLEQITLDQVNKDRLTTAETRFHILWVGTKTNLVFLEKILPQIETAAIQIQKKTGKKVYLRVVCNEALHYKTSTFVLENITWSRKRAGMEMLSAHVGIMPLEDTEFTRGKGGFKGIQYMSAGLPCIMSKVGFNSEVLEGTDCGFLVSEFKEWVDSLVELSCNHNLWERMSKNARTRWETAFNGREHREFWENIVKNQKDK